MAIFGKADADMPWLSQVAQVDTENPTELTHVAQWCTDRPIYEGLSVEAHDESLRAFTYLCRLTQEILDTLYNLGGITEQQKDGLNFFLCRFPNVIKETGPTELHPLPLSEDRAERSNERSYIIPVKSIGKARTTGELKDLPMLLLVDHIEELFVLLAEGRIRLARCTACSSIFLERRNGQIYCSHRCANRVGVRRRRQKQRTNSAPLQTA